MAIATSGHKSNNKPKSQTATVWFRSVALKLIEIRFATFINKCMLLSSKFKCGKAPVHCQLEVYPGQGRALQKAVNEQALLASPASSARDQHQNRPVGCARLKQQAQSHLYAGHSC